MLNKKNHSIKANSNTYSQKNLILRMKNAPRPHLPPITETLGCYNNFLLVFIAINIGYDNNLYFYYSYLINILRYSTRRRTTTSKDFGVVTDKSHALFHFQQNNNNHHHHQDDSFFHCCLSKGELLDISMISTFIVLVLFISYGELVTL